MRLKAALLVLLLAIAGGTRALPAQTDDTTLSVMTRNQYFGGNLFPVAAAPDIPSFFAAARAVLAEIAANNFPERAQALAREIADRRPHIVALQEVDDFTLNGSNSAPPFVEQLEATMDALEALGAHYVKIAQVQNVNVTVPADLDGDGVPDGYVSVLDRDVILARADLVAAGAVTPVPLSKVCLRPSADFGPGCNYNTFASVNILGNEVRFERGFVAVDVVLGGRTYRVVNTHLEVENLDPSNPLSPFIQAAQATELKAVLDATSAGVTLIVTGDINSTPEDQLFPNPVSGPLVRPFQQFVEGVDLFGQPTPGGAYLDTWALRPGNPAGYTCCDDNLSTEALALTERKDVMFVRERPAAVKANVFGIDPADKTPSGLWPSDHAGLFVRFVF